MEIVYGLVCVIYLIWAILVVATNQGKEDVEINKTLLILMLLSIAIGSLSDFLRAIGA